MAIPFYENEENLQQQTPNTVNEEIDQVDGPAINTTNNPLYHSHSNLQQNSTNQAAVSEEDLMAWKILALAMCKALKDYYQQNINPIPANTSNPTTTSENSTAIIQILPNGQVQPKWN